MSHSYIRVYFKITFYAAIPGIPRNALAVLKLFRSFLLAKPFTMTFTHFALLHTSKKHFNEMQRASDKSSSASPLQNLLLRPDLQRNVRHNAKQHETTGSSLSMQLFQVLRTKCPCCFENVSNGFSSQAFYNDFRTCRTPAYE